MKKLFVLLVALTVSLTTALNAKELRKMAQKLPVDFKHEIADHLKYPKSAQNNMVEGEVWMQVTLDANSLVKIVELSATNPELGNYVREELTDLYIKNSSFQAGNVYYLKVKFDLIQR